MGSLADIDRVLWSWAVYWQHERAVILVNSDSKALGAQEKKRLKTPDVNVITTELALARRQEQRGDDAWRFRACASLSRSCDTRAVASCDDEKSIKTSSQESASGLSSECQGQWFRPNSMQSLMVQHARGEHSWYRFGGCRECGTHWAAV